ncbi:MAG: hypothetical protein AAB565_01815, partial [Patescibacteria group bacterium]
YFCQEETNFHQPLSEAGLARGAYRTQPSWHIVLSSKHRGLGRYSNGGDKRTITTLADCVLPE